MIHLLLRSAYSDRVILTYLMKKYKDVLGVLQFGCVQSGKFSSCRRRSDILYGIIDEQTGEWPMLLTTESVWQEFNVGLKQFILKRIQDEQSADDILQEVFLKIHTRIATLRDEEKLPGWVYQIARNAIYDYYREQRATVVDLPEVPYMPEDPHDDVIAELAPCIRRMVNSLPTHYRQALILTEYEGVSQKALSEQLGLSFSGAKSRVQRARQQIKQMLLDCCHFQFDTAGRIIDYQPKCACCASQACVPG